MDKLTARAVKKDEMLMVTVSGFLPDSCHEAKVAGTYPGGIVHVQDPGVAEVHIEETAKPGGTVCTMVLTPWTATVYIRDTFHDKVRVLINGGMALEIPVTGETNQFVVIALIGGGASGCSVIPEGAVYLAIYSQVFGPASYDECKAWVAKNCKA